MKQTFWKDPVLLGGTLGLGLLASVLQSRAMEYGYDAKGLFVWNNSAQLALLGTAAVFAVLLLALTGAWIPREASFEQSFPRCWLRGCAGVLAGAMLALDIFYALEPMPRTLELLGFLAAAAMAAAGCCAAMGKRPHWGLHGLVCIYILVWLLMRYRVWGGSAHLERYAWPMLAGLLLMLYAFHRCAADAGAVSPKKLMRTGLGGVFCSLIALTDCTDRVFFLAMVIWVISSLCRTGSAPQAGEQTAEP